MTRHALQERDPVVFLVRSSSSCLPAPPGTHAFLAHHPGLAAPPPSAAPPATNLNWRRKNDWLPSPQAFPNRLSSTARSVAPRRLAHRPSTHHHLPPVAARGPLPLLRSSGIELP